MEQIEIVTTIHRLFQMKFAPFCLSCLSFHILHDLCFVSHKLFRLREKHTVSNPKFCFFLLFVRKSWQTSVPRRRRRRTKEDRRVGMRTMTVRITITITIIITIIIIITIMTRYDFTNTAPVVGITGYNTLAPNDQDAVMNHIATVRLTTWSCDDKT